MTTMKRVGEDVEAGGGSARAADRDSPSRQPMLQRCHSYRVGAVVWQVPGSSIPLAVAVSPMQERLAKASKRPTWRPNEVDLTTYTHTGGAWDSTLQHARPTLVDSRVALRLALCNPPPTLLTHILSQQISTPQSQAADASWTIANTL